MSHALVIGGSGMLRGAVLSLCKRFKAVSVVGRSARRLGKLQREDSGVRPLMIDYTDSSGLISCIDQAVSEHGPISLVVSWIHETAPDAPLLVAKALNKGEKSVDYYHVLGSAYARPDAGAAELRKAFETLPLIRYHQIVLGFIVEGECSRWLTNEEISLGVTRAITSQLKQSTVGTTEPWSMRP